MAKFNEYEKVGKEHGIGGGFFNLQKGNNKIRVVTEFESYGLHRIMEIVDEKKKWKKNTICLGKDECLICAERYEMVKNGADPKSDEVKELNPGVKFIGWVIDREEGKEEKDRQDTPKFELLTIGYTIFKQFGELSQLPDTMFEFIPAWDATIIKKGEGKGTEYSVVADRKDIELTEIELKGIAELKSPAEIIDAMKIKAEKEKEEPAEEDGEEIDISKDL